MTFEMPFFLFLFCAGEDPRIHKHGICRVVGLNSRPNKVDHGPFVADCRRLPFAFPPSFGKG